MELHRQRTRQSDTVSPHPTQRFYDFFFRVNVIFVAEEALLLTHRGLPVDAAAPPCLVALALGRLVTFFLRGKSGGGGRQQPVFCLLIKSLGGACAHTHHQATGLTPTALR